jgi:hypothetical protein
MNRLEQLSRVVRVVRAVDHRYLIESSSGTIDGDRFEPRECL